MKTTIIILALCAAIFFSPAESDETGYKGIREDIEEHAVVIMGRSCSVVGCHGGKKAAAELNLEEAKLADMAGKPSGQLGSFKLIDTAAPEKSYFLMKIRGDKGIKGSRMPVWVDPLTSGETKTLHLWVYSLHLDGKKE